MTQLTAFLSLMIALSAATERVVEIIKGFIPFLANADNTKDAKGNVSQKEAIRRAALQILAIVAGIGCAYGAGPDIYTSIGFTTTGSAHVPAEYLPVVVGLMASGGSAMWNHALDIVRASKVNIESGNQGQGGGGQQGGQ